MLRHVIGELPIGYFIYNQIENKNNLTVEPTYGRGMGHMESCSHIIQLRQLVGVEVGAQTDDCNCNLCQSQSNTMQYYLLFRYFVIVSKTFFRSNCNNYHYKTVKVRMTEMMF